MERRFIEQAKDMYKKDYTRESMVFYLKDAGAQPSAIDAILDVALQEYIAWRTQKYKLNNKVIFYATATLTAVLLILLLGVLPGRDMVIGYTTLFSILGTAFICVLVFYAWMYRDTWKSPFVEKHGKPTIQYAFLPLFLVPGVILYFIFSIRFSMAQDAALKDSRVEAVGHIRSGSHVGVRRVIGGGEVNYSTVTVGFQTKNGDSVVVIKEVPDYKFKDFYIGQEIHLIYSKTNPQNIDLLADDESIRNFKQTQQRPLEMADLLRLATIEPGQLSTELNKISYGWTFNPANNFYVNEHFQTGISSTGHGLVFMGPQDVRLTFPDFLKTNGFKQIGKDDPQDMFQTGPKVFENAKFRVNLSVVLDHPGVDGDGHAVVIISSK